MRWLALALLLVNLGLFGWQYATHVENRTRVALATEPLPPDTPTLVMLSELDELPASKSPEERPDPVPAGFSEVYDHVDRADVCVDVGPFPDISTRDAFRDWIRDYVAELNMRVEQVRERQFFWVYLEPTTDEAAQAQMSSLERKGVTDIMLIRRGDLKNAISLGLFRSQDSVNRRLAEMSEKGYQPVVVPRFRAKDHYWFTAALADEYGTELELPPSLLGEATARTIDCASI
ncbi:MAG: hypothetical protein ACU85V_12480 [Gammaproteobacteria bacterium]